MNLKEAYNINHGDYDDVLIRFGSEKRVEKFLLMIPQDKNYQLLVDSLNNKDYENAFIAIHTIKGITVNLGLTQAFESASKLTELLRSKTYNDQIDDAFEEFNKDYILLIDTLKQIDKE